MTSERILIVDDNVTNLKLVAYLVRAKGYEVATAVDAETALEAVRTARPRLILMDLQLPGMDGLEATRLLKDDPDTRSIPVVALTAQAMKGDEARIREAGCDGYLSKPIDYKLLVAEVEARCRA